VSRQLQRSSGGARPADGGGSRVRAGRGGRDGGGGDFGDPVRSGRGAGGVGDTESRSRAGLGGKDLMPRAGLNRERIAAQAAVVADEMGFDRLTLAAVAARCGVSLPGLYKHVSGLEAVKRDVAVLSIRDLTAALAGAAAGLARRDA